MMAHLLRVKSFTAGPSLPLCHSFYFSFPQSLPLQKGALPPYFLSQDHTGIMMWFSVARMFPVSLSLLLQEVFKYSRSPPVILVVVCL